MKVAVTIGRTHNPFDETCWASCLRENLTSSSYGEGLETDRICRVPRQSLTRQRSFAWLEKCRRLWKNCERKLETSRQFIVLAFLALLLRRQ
jgi:hypothetical protein